VIEDQARVAIARPALWRRGPFVIAAAVVAGAAVIVAVLFATGTFGGGAPGASDPYCPGVVRALPGHVPTSTEAAIDDIDQLTAVTPVGKDQQVASRVFPVDRAIEKIGMAYSSASGLAGLTEPSATEVASYYSAVSQLRSYCG
jgi:hypothetical protein